MAKLSQMQIISNELGEWQSRLNRMRCEPSADAIQELANALERTMDTIRKIAAHLDKQMEE